VWSELRGKWAYQAGAAGTATLPKGAQVLQIIVEGGAGGTVTIFGGTAIPCVSGTPKAFRFNHLECASKAGTQDIVFTNTVSYYVEYVEPQNA